MFVVTVHFVIKKGHTQSFMEAMLRQAVNSLNEEAGCLQFDVCQDPMNEDRVFLYEMYTDAAAFEEHLKTAHFLDFDKTVTPWTESKHAEQWSRLHG